MQVTHTQVSLIYDIPMSEVVVDFFDRLKSASRGFASLDYGFSRFEPAPLVRLDILINEERVDSLAVYRAQRCRDVTRSSCHIKTEGSNPATDVRCRDTSRYWTKKFSLELPSKHCEKNVTAKCYGGDVTRKRKLLEKTESRQKKNEADRSSRSTAAGFYGCFDDRSNKVTQTSRAKKMTKFCKVSIRNHVLTVTLNRPKRLNALHPPAHQEIVGCIRRIRQQRRVVDCSNNRRRPSLLCG